ncbi:hypothetical protein [Halobaculum magnesiiphilum]|uniref:Uncharacterized protein n=1 Tax=Halobaculum magnesiiphilum TaxID=1017351 RepID=A0A8T8WB81_9EURY|nr:hypothetical protein [Halobaculum magnesiiphilum]QZP37085.1 hypothetical protein K6T50_12405 [Halobaculum magnesiiphilum]
MTSKRISLLVALALIATLFGPAISVGVAAPQTTDAELAISQPHYVDGEIQTSSANGTSVYQAGAVPLSIVPQNFAADNVVDYGIETDGGNAELTYDEAMDRFVSTADADGTYAVYWSVEREVAVENESGNGSRIETRRERYTSKIRLSGLTDMVHQPAGDLEATREQADKWSEWNATVNDARETIGNGLLVQIGLASPPTTQETLQGMVNAYLTFKAPLHMLTGNYTQILTLITFTFGGWLFVATVILPLIVVIAGLAYRSNRFEITEAEEGRLSKRAGEMAKREDQQSLANDTHNDVWDDDYIASAMRAEGDDPLTATTNWLAKFRPRYQFHARLQAMAADGWVGVVDRRVRSDGGEESGDGDNGASTDTETASIVDAHVAREDAVDEDADTVSLNVTPDDDLLDALDWSQVEIWEEFDLLAAEIDPAEVRTTPVDVYDLEELVELTDLDMRQFEDESHAAQNMIELFQFIRENPLTDEHGTPDTLRYGLEHHLRAARLLDERFHMPIDGYIDQFEKALAEYDAGADAKRTLDEIREGGHA